eukprot:jgi/Chlat1/5698/Chrsp38S05546
MAATAAAGAWRKAGRRSPAPSVTGAPPVPTPPLPPPPSAAPAAAPQPQPVTFPPPGGGGGGGGGGRGVVGVGKRGVAIAAHLSALRTKEDHRPLPHPASPSVVVVAASADLDPAESASLLLCLSSSPSPSAAVLAEPFRFEGGKRAAAAREVARAVRGARAAVVTVRQDALIAQRDITLPQAMAAADKVACWAARALDHVLTRSTHANDEARDLLSRCVSAHVGHAGTHTHTHTHTHTNNNDTHDVDVAACVRSAAASPFVWDALPSAHAALCVVTDNNTQSITSEVVVDALKEYVSTSCRILAFHERADSGDNSGIDATIDATIIAMRLGDVGLTQQQEVVEADVNEWRDEYTGGVLGDVVDDDVGAGQPSTSGEEEGVLALSSNNAWLKSVAEVVGLRGEGEEEVDDGVGYGRVKMAWPDGSEYDGEWRRGRPWGCGEFRYADACTTACGSTAAATASVTTPMWPRVSVTGGWENDVPEGVGTVVYASGDRYKGGFSKGLRHGAGVLTRASGEVVKEEWQDGVRVSTQR